MEVSTRREQWFRVVVFTDVFDYDTAILEPFVGRFVPLAHFNGNHSIPRFYVALSLPLAQRIQQLDVFKGINPWAPSSPVWCLERLSSMGEWKVVFWKCGTYTPGYDSQGFRVIVVPPALRETLLGKFAPYINQNNSKTQALRAAAGLGLRCEGNSSAPCGVECPEWDGAMCPF